MTAKFKIVKHRFKYHVIGYTGVVKPRSKGVKPTYKEQCISSHITRDSALKAIESYKAIKLHLSNKEEPKTLRNLLKELHLGMWIAILCGLGYEAIKILFIH